MADRGAAKRTKRVAVVVSVAVPEATDETTVLHDILQGLDALICTDDEWSYMEHGPVKGHLRRRRG